MSEKSIFLLKKAPSHSGNETLFCRRDEGIKWGQREWRIFNEKELPGNYRRVISPPTGRVWESEGDEHNGCWAAKAFWLMFHETQKHCGDWKDEKDRKNRKQTWNGREGERESVAFQQAENFKKKKRKEMKASTSGVIAERRPCGGGGATLVFTC